MLFDQHQSNIWDSEAKNNFVEYSNRGLSLHSKRLGVHGLDKYGLGTGPAAVSCENAN
jgi:hypothetical protein